MVSVYCKNRIYITLFLKCFLCQGAARPRAIIPREQQGGHKNNFLEVFSAPNWHKIISSKNMEMLSRMIPVDGAAIWMTESEGSIFLYPLEHGRMNVSSYSRLRSNWILENYFSWIFHSSFLICCSLHRSEVDEFLDGREQGSRVIHGSLRSVQLLGGSAGRSGAVHVDPARMASHYEQGHRMGIAGTYVDKSNQSSIM